MISRTVIGEPVNYKNIETSGVPIFDTALVHSFVCKPLSARPTNYGCHMLRYQFFDKFGAKYVTIDKELLKLGHKPGSIEDFVKTDLKGYMQSVSN